MHDRHFSTDHQCEDERQALCSDQEASRARGKMQVAQGNDDNVEGKVGVQRLNRELPDRNLSC
ncbi:hypothetical protein D9M68_1001540 [compost metagenome]